MALASGWWGLVCVSWLILGSCQCGLAGVAGYVLAWTGHVWVGRGTWLRERCRYPSISGLVVEYIDAIDVTRVRFPADAASKGDAKSPDDLNRYFFAASLIAESLIAATASAQGGK